MKEFMIGNGDRCMSDKGKQCKWLDVVLLDETGTIFENENWIPKFVNAETEKEAREIFNSRFQGEWEFTSNHSVHELTPHAWLERKSMADLFRRYVHVGILLYLSKTNTPDLSHNCFDDINHHYINRNNLFEIKRTIKGFYLLSMCIGYTPIDSDSQYLYMILDKNGKIIEPFNVDGPWVCIMSKLERQGYM